ncbi:MAG: BamA/TamA family outer membrane protein [Vicinamibacterales bacterium]
MKCRFALLGFLLPAIVLAAAPPCEAQSRYRPSLQFQVLESPNFWIYHHQGEEEIARRFAEVAEDIHRTLTSSIGTRPRGRTHVILVDQNDKPNGWATTLPHNTIEIDVSWPPGDDLLGNTEDWLRLVFAHEYAHIIQADISRGIARPMRALFGRSPLAFPNMLLPAWLVEGFSTYEESAATEHGRIRSGSFQAIVDEPLRLGDRLPMDRAGRGLIDWPSGTAPYAWGGFFVDYLAGRFGHAKLGELMRETAGCFYFLAPAAFERVYGEKLGDLWRDFQDSRAAAAREKTDSPAGTRLTRHGYIVSAPRIVGNEILYSLATAHGFPSIMSVTVDGGAEPRRLGDMYLGGSISHAHGLVWFSRVELEDNVALRSDLYIMDRAHEKVTRVTRGGRYLDPDVSPDGRSVVAVALRNGRRLLALLDVHGRPDQPERLSVVERSLLGENAAEYSSPRWSPDGRTIAASRRRHGGPSEIVLIDPASGETRPVVSSGSARNVSPAWVPGGASIIFASDMAGGPLNLFEVDIGEGQVADRAGAPNLRQITFEPGGAAEPDVSPDGSFIVYVGYTSDGYDVFRTGREVFRKSAPAHGGAHGESRKAFRRSDPPEDVSTARAGSTAVSRRYSPWPTVLPRYWLPQMEVEDRQVRLGAVTSGADLLDRHSWQALASWRMPRDASGGVESRPDWEISYVYGRWRPALFLDVSDETELYSVPAESPGDHVARARVREASAGVFVPFRSVRRSHALQAGIVVQRHDLTAGDGRTLTRDRNAIRLAWSFNSARIYTASISPEDGFAASATSEHVRDWIGASGNADAVTAQARGFLHMGPQHAVLATRVAAGAAFGDVGVRRRFFLGSNGPAAGLADFGGDALNLLRGFEDTTLSGSRIVSATIEYRVPVVRIERGLGPWPFFARTLHASAFVDAGAAWSDGLISTDLKRSFGAEISLDLVVGHWLQLTATAGVAFPNDPLPVVRGTKAYVRLGRSF